VSAFSHEEVEYLQSGRLGRLATVGCAGTPHVVPVGFSYNAELGTIDIRGRDMANTKKFRDVARSGRAALVVDDVRPPWKPQGIEIRGRAEALGGARPVIRIHPEHVVAWGIEGDGFRPDSRSAEAAR
jgi:pyridoxamine 5'-phosphate oxidase family protein